MFVSATFHQSSLTICFMSVLRSYGLLCVAGLVLAKSILLQSTAHSCSLQIVYCLMLFFPPLEAVCPDFRVANTVSRIRSDLSQ
ncbi:hypothetical protein BDR07DRAFT_1434118 [Suillus spraguei]|nr:hypothetical protein BDR07DRAFT_1434118 [Suillus spraguei]